jgi:hypothetical protein
MSIEIQISGTNIECTSHRLPFESQYERRSRRWEMFQGADEGRGFGSSVSCIHVMAKTCMMTLRYAQIGAFFDR